MSDTHNTDTHNAGTHHHWRINHTDVSKFALSCDDLSQKTNPAILPKTTKSAKAFDPSFGQTRAVEAILTALDIKANGYNIFAVGENGLGKRTIIKHLLKQRALHEPTPPDLIYVHNFDNPRCPLALSLPAGMGKIFAEDMQKLWQMAHKNLVQKFSNLRYQNQLGSIKKFTHNKQTTLIAAINRDAKAHNLILNQSTIAQAQTDDLDGFYSFGVLDNKQPVDEKALGDLQKKLVELNFALDELEDLANAKIDDLHDSLATRALEALFRPLLKKYPQKQHPKLHQYLLNCMADMVNNAVRIVDNEDEFVSSHTNIPARYSVNVLVSHTPNMGAPIVFEDMPTHLNLLGHIEHITELGSVYSDVSMIRAGALHRANGGYLLLEAQSLLEHPYAWQGLKRALQSSQIKISSLEQMLTLTGSLSLEPQAADLSLKVILLGEPDLYYELLEFEPEFDAVFKVRADFHDTAPRSEVNEICLAHKIADMVKSYQLLPFNNKACALIIDHLSALSDDKHKLDLHSDRLAQILLEANRTALVLGAKTVNAEHIARTLQARNHRRGYLKELYWQELNNGQQLISTQGRATGQINALTVISYADSEFGLPARLTAAIAPNFGHGDILDIERDVELGGSLHAKGMLIMTSYLRGLFSEFYPMNFSASLAFEQSYGQIDGDSATLAEACALLSALSGLPMRQDLAITGSMNQLGQVQAVGGINAKIEGFFDVCHSRGLTGTQGVILPLANVHNLMLKDEIIYAVAKGQFHLYAICHINDALQLLSGLPIDNKNKNQLYHKDSLFGKVGKRLKQFDEKPAKKRKKRKSKNDKPKQNVNQTDNICSS